MTLYPLAQFLAYVATDGRLSMDAEVAVLPPATALEDYVRRRASLAQLLRDTDAMIARLSEDDGPPYVVVRDDGAVYLGHQKGYGHDLPPHRLTYRGAAERRAKLDGGVVLPFSTWTNARTAPLPGVTGEETR
jgi:hypothetical protein